MSVDRGERGSIGQGSWFAGRGPRGELAHDLYIIMRIVPSAWIQHRISYHLQFEKQPQSSV